MGVKSACCVGCCVTLAVVSLLIGINAMLRYRATQLDHEESAKYSIPANCTLMGFYHRITRTESGDDCNIWRYMLDVRTIGETPERDLGIKVAYSNFFPDRCGGTHYNQSRIETEVPCWMRPETSPYVRISPVFVEQEMYLTVGAVALAVAGTVLVAFIIYNVILWLGVCADVGPFSQENVRRREAEAAAEAEAAEARDQAEPFDSASIEVADHGWLADMAFNNAYAKAVIRRFGHNTGTSPTNSDQEMVNDPHFVQTPSSATERETTVVAVSSAAGSESGVHSASGSVKETPDSADPDGVAGTECCVCWESMAVEAVVFPCFHVACTGCVDRLVRESHRKADRLMACPMCRRQCFPVELRRLLRKGAEGELAECQETPGQPTAATSE